MHAKILKPARKEQKHCVAAIDYKSVSVKLFGRELRVLRHRLNSVDVRDCDSELHLMRLQGQALGEKGGVQREVAGKETVVDGCDGMVDGMFPRDDVVKNLLHCVQGRDMNIVLGGLVGAMFFFNQFGGRYI